MDLTNDTVYSGTLGGTIALWNTQLKKGNHVSTLIMLFLVSGKLSGHLSNCSTLMKNLKYLVSGSLDTNVKVWDYRMKNCVTTFKGHND